MYVTTKFINKKPELHLQLGKKGSSSTDTNKSNLHSKNTSQHNIQSTSNRTIAI